MKTFLLVLTTILNLVSSHTQASILHRRNIKRSEPLPPESHLSQRNITLFDLARVASNLTIPLPPSTTPTFPPSPVPTPMDLSISYALSSTCMIYLTSVLSSYTFQSCLPFSLLLSTSTSYAELLSSALASGDLSHINALVAYMTSPQPSGDQCGTYFQGVLVDMIKKDKCAADIKDNKAIAKEARDGVGSYALMREAVGLTDPDQGEYCYLQAVAAETPDDLYLWSIPQGVSLPSTLKPTCSKCSALLLSHYAESVDSTPTLNGTIVQSAINQINSACGAAFATYKADAKTGAVGGRLTPSASFFGVVLVGLVWRLLSI